MGGDFRDVPVGIWRYASIWHVADLLIVCGIVEGERRWRLLLQGSIPTELISCGGARERRRMCMRRELVDAVVVGRRNGVVSVQGNLMAKKRSCDDTLARAVPDSLQAAARIMHDARRERWFGGRGGGREWWVRMSR